MKINTKEKLQILMFGLNAGKNLNMSWHSRQYNQIIFSDDDDDVRFYLEHDGSIECYSDSSDEDYYEHYYKILGCMQHSTSEANQLFPKIKS